MILVQGTLTVVFNGDERSTLKAGDVLVQRGTIHGFHNESNEWARVFCVMMREYRNAFRSIVTNSKFEIKIAAKKVQLGVKELETIFLPPKE